MSGTSNRGSGGTSSPAAHDDRLHARLDAPLPDELAVGRGTALFICGTCFHCDAAIRSVAILVDGVEQPVLAHGMPRLDLFRSLHRGLDPSAAAGLQSDPDSAEDPELHSYRSGFWGIVRIGPRSSGTCELLIRAQLDTGAEATASLATVAVSSTAQRVAIAPPDPEGGPMVAVCMATYEPPMDLFRCQLDSIRSQTHGNWVCVVSDDCSTPARFAEMQSEIARDPRFVISRSPRRLGFYRNFERALSTAPPNADYVALADQDDIWHPAKLAVLLAAIGNAQLVYSDARLIDRARNVISNTYWSRRQNDHTDLLSLLLANSVTGAASLFPLDLLDHALPFPPPQFAHFHDHWLALTALALGDIAFVDRALYDYVQHDEAVLGHQAANRVPALRDRLDTLRRDPRERAHSWRLRYFVDAMRLLECATILQMRCGERMSPAKRRKLDRLVRSDASALAVAVLWLLGVRELIGSPTTLGAEWKLASAFTWRRLLNVTARHRPVKGLRLDAAPPTELAPRPAKAGLDSPTISAIDEKIRPLDFAVSERAPARVNVLIPTIDLVHFFGGYIGKFNLARRLAERGLRVRIVTVDPVGPLPRQWQHAIESYSGLSGLFEKVEVAFGRETRHLEFGRSDSFVATTWWTAFIAHSALASLARERFLYLIQEYEPFTFPMGTYAALARQSYEFPHHALFSTELLRDYFRIHAIGVYADGVKAGDMRSTSFQNAITAIEPPSVGELQTRGARRLLFYARPELHASRNMFELGVLSLRRAVERGVFGDGWELHGMGTVEGRRVLGIADHVKLEILPRSSQGTYANLLREYDVGLALMYTPHPSLVPIEMASAGMLTVTNTFENKTQQAMTAISSNLLAPSPTIEGIAEALGLATSGAGDYERRARGSAVEWSRDWNRSFADGIIDRVTAFLSS